MANSINSKLQNNIISQSALEAFATILSPLQGFSTSFNDEAARRGSTINVTTLSATSDVADFTGTYASQDTTYGTTQISLDQHKFVTWHVTDTEQSESSAVELERFGYQKGAELAKAVYQNILAEVTNANYSTAGFSGAASGFDSDDVADLRADAINNGLPVEQCALVLSPDYFAALLKDGDIAGYFDYGSADIVRGGRIPSLFGIGYVQESAGIPGNSENLVGFIAHPSAMAVAMRYLEPTNTSGYIAARRLYDDETGMVMGYREFYEESTGTQTAVLECVWGKKVAVAGGLTRITSA